MPGCGPQFIDQHDRIRITTDSNVHSGPGQEYKTIATVSAGVELILLESTNDWHRVRLQDGRTGWVFRGVTQTVGPEKIITIEETKIRRGPGAEYEPIAITQQGVTLDARGEQGNWYLVDLPNGQTGWMLKSQAKKVTYRILTTTKSGKIYQLPNSNSTVLMTVDADEELLELNRQGDYYMVKLADGGTGWIHKDTITPAKESLLTVKERTDVKFGPSIEFDAVETVEKGTRLILLDQSGDWYQVRTPLGKTGWIYKQFIVPTLERQDVSIVGTPVYLVTNTDCNIRNGGGTNYPIIAKAKKGTILVKISQQNDWLRVKLPDQSIGWIQEDLVNYNPTILITLDNCNIRLGPSTNFRVKTTVPKGTPLAKISEQSGWSEVYLPDGEVGWIRNDLRADPEKTLFVKEDCNVRDGPGTSYQRIDRLTAGTPVIQLDKQDNWYKVQLPSKQTGWIREDLLRETPNQLVTNERVNIRYGPSTLFRVLEEVEKNTPLTLIEEQDGWLRVKLTDGRIGWIRKDLVSFSYYPITSDVQSTYDSNITSSEPKPSSTISSLPPPVTPSKLGVKMTTTSAVNLRIQPSTSESIIKLLPAGTQVTRINQRGEWYEVQTEDGVLGFVHQSGFSTGDNKLYTNAASNLRSGPGTGFQSVTLLPEKAELTKIEQRDNWIYVQMTSGQKGWIREDLVNSSKAAAPPPPIKTEAVSGTLITTGDAKILQGPDDNYPTVKSVKINTELKTISKYQNWYEVEALTGEKGWIADKFVKEKENKKIIVIRKTEVHQEPNTQSTLITVVDVADFYAPLSQQGGWYRIPVKPGITGWIMSQDVLELKYPPVYVNTTSADVMKFADEKSTRLAIIKEGVQLIPIDETDEWLFVQLPRGDRGWINKKLVDRQKFPRIKIVKDTEAYEQPTAGSLLKSTLTKDDEFLALDSKNNWYKILLRGSVIGWVYGGYVKEINKGSLLVKEDSFLRMGPGLEYRKITTVPGGEKVKWLDQKGDWNQVQIANGEIGWIYEQLAKDITMPQMTAQTNSSVYAGPGTNFAKVGEVVRGRRYTPINKRLDWYQIQLTTGTEGWVPMSVFSPQKSRVVFTLDKANIRSGPGMQFGIVETLQPAVDLTIIGVEGDWYYVQMQDGKKGYIRKDLVFEE